MLYLCYITFPLYILLVLLFSRVERKGIHSEYNTTEFSEGIIVCILVLSHAWTMISTEWNRNVCKWSYYDNRGHGLFSLHRRKKDGCYYVLRNRNKDFTFVTFTDVNLLLFLFLRSFLIIVLFQRQGAGRNLENGREEQLQLSVCNLNFTHKKTTGGVHLLVDGSVVSQEANVGFNKRFACLRKSQGKCVYWQETQFSGELLHSDFFLHFILPFSCFLVVMTFVRLGWVLS